MILKYCFEILFQLYFFLTRFLAFLPIYDLVALSLILVTACIKDSGSYLEILQPTLLSIISLKGGLSDTIDGRPQDIASSNPNGKPSPLLNKK